eukprot:TRINITY_DN4347_c0_g1_i1.p1 TRINITY_DN4347_c0_g1~~TRINITY_DN4347_c0_g1_i1.p1  ORF type:complete len:1076 (+),score=339.96 TRINITY_DN4347_c0_g1_i1:106-3333(+)
MEAVVALPAYPWQAPGQGSPSVPRPLHLLSPSAKVAAQPTVGFSMDPLLLLPEARIVGPARGCLDSSRQAPASDAARPASPRPCGTPMSLSPPVPPASRPAPAQAVVQSPALVLHVDNMQQAASGYATGSTTTPQRSAESLGRHFHVPDAAIPHGYVTRAAPALPQRSAQRPGHHVDSPSGAPLAVPRHIFTRMRRVLTDMEAGLQEDLASPSTPATSSTAAAPQTAADPWLTGVWLGGQGKRKHALETRQSQLTTLQRLVEEGFRAGFARHRATEHGQQLAQLLEHFSELERTRAKLHMETPFDPDMPPGHLEMSLPELHGRAKDVEAHLREAVASWEAHVKSEVKQTEQLSHCSARLGGSIQQHKIEICQLEQLLEEATREAQHSGRCRAVVQEKARDLQRKLEQAMGKESDAAMVVYGARVKELSERMATLQEQCQVAAVSEQAKTDDLRDVRKELKERLEDISKLKAELVAEGEEKEMIAQQLQEREDKIIRLEETLKASRDSLLALREEAKEQRAIAEAAGLRAKEVEARLASAVAERNDSIGLQSAAQEKVTALEEKLNEFQDLVPRLKSDTQSLRDLQGQAEELRVASQDRIAELERGLEAAREEKQRSADSLEGKVKEQEERLSKALEDNMLERERCSLLERQVQEEQEERLSKALEDNMLERERCSLLERQVQEAVVKEAALAQHLKDAEQLAHERQMLLDAARNSSRSRLSSMEQRLSVGESERNELALQLARSNSEKAESSESQRQQLKEMKERLKESMQAQQQLAQQLRDLQSKQGSHNAPAVFGANSAAEAAGDSAKSSQGQKQQQEHIRYLESMLEIGEKLIEDAKQTKEASDKEIRELKAALEQERASSRQQQAQHAHSSRHSSIKAEAESMRFESQRRRIEELENELEAERTKSEELSNKAKSLEADAAVALKMRSSVVTGAPAEASEEGPGRKARSKSCFVQFDEKAFGADSGSASGGDANSDGGSEGSHHGRLSTESRSFNLARFSVRHNSTIQVPTEAGALQSGALSFMSGLQTGSILATSDVGTGVSEVWNTMDPALRALKVGPVAQRMANVRSM